MIFLYPNILWFLSLIALPIIIHLFHFRRHKKLYFSSLKFIHSIEQEKKAVKKLKNYIILLLRVLAIVFVVLAFAQPYTGSYGNSSAGSDRLISIYIDNSNSMSAKGTNGELLSEAKTNAKEIISQFPANQKFIISSNELNGIQERSLSKTDALFQIDQINYTPIQRNINTIVNWQREISEKEKNNNRKLNKFSYILLSDFQRDFFKTDNIEKDLNSPYNLIQFSPQSKSNCFVDSVWFESPVHRINEENDLYFRVVNRSNNDIINLEVNIQTDNSDKDLFVDIPAQEKITSSIQIKNTKKGQVFGIIEIRDQMMYWDDLFYFSYNIEPSNNILIINGDGHEEYVNNAYSTESSIDIEEVDQKLVNRNLFKEKNLIVLNGVNDISTGLSSDLLSFSEMGGSIFIIPGKNALKNNTNLLLSNLGLPPFSSKRTVNLNANKIASKDPFFKSIFEPSDETLNLPNYKSIYNGDVLNTTAIPLMFLRDKSPVFFKSFQKTFALYSDLSLESSNLVNKSIFPVLCLRIAELSKRNHSLYTIIGQNQLIPVSNNYKAETPIKIKNKQTEFIPKIIQNGSYKFLDLSGPEAIEKLKEGNYRIFTDKTIGALSLITDRKESSVDYMSSESIKKSLQQKNIKNINVENFSKGFDVSKINLNQPQEYWRICIFIVIMCVISEIFISKFWKN